jgi:hypothetical protein
VTAPGWSENPWSDTGIPLLDTDIVTRFSNLSFFPPYKRVPDPCFTISDFNVCFRLTYKRLHEMY